MVIVPIVTLLAVVSLGLLITKIAASAMVYTGVSREMARFQARSAFTGVGFTTSETENMVGHPVRRRIVMALMLLGNAGFVSAIASMIPILGNAGSASGLGQLGLVFCGILTLWAISRSRWLDYIIMRATGYAMRRFTRMDLFDYTGLLHFSEGYAVGEIAVGPSHWLTGHNLIDLKLKDEGVQVIGIQRANKDYVATPKGTTYIRSGDVVIVYGRHDQIEELRTRERDRAGQEAHERRVVEQDEIDEALEVEERRETDPRPSDS